jgi:hypothetical protein
VAFVERQLRFTFSGAQTGTLSVAGLRAVASIQAFQGRLGVSAQVSVWGLSLAQMNTYSSRISAGVGVDQFALAIEAGDIGGTLHQVVNGAIWRSDIDLEGEPESAFRVSVAGIIYQASKPMAPQSWAGAQNAETLISSVCAAAGLTLHNNGAHAVLRNMSTYGSAIDQIADIARAAKFSLYIEGSGVWIWPSKKPRDTVVIDSLPDDRDGYPVWWEAGIVVRQLFDQRIQVGRQMNVTSSIPKANGLWQIVQVQHDLSTMLRGGPWFSTAVLAPVGFA